MDVSRLQWQAARLPQISFSTTSHHQIPHLLGVNSSLSHGDPSPCCIMRWQMNSQLPALPRTPHCPLLQDPIFSKPLPHPHDLVLLFCVKKHQKKMQKISLYLHQPKGKRISTAKLGEMKSLPFFKIWGQFSWLYPQTTRKYHTTESSRTCI